MSDPDSGLGLLDDPGPAESAPDGAARKRWHPLRWALLALAGLLALGLLVIGFYAVRGVQALDQITRSSTLLPDDSDRPSATVPTSAGGKAPVNFVLMGSDTRGGERGRSDVLMIAHLDAARDRIYLISFPRDMYVTIPGHGKNKINAAYSFGGPALAVRTLEKLLDVRMDHTAIIDFEGFIGLSNEVGGVTFFNEINSASGGYTYPRGDLTLSGEKLLAYVRERYDLPGGDLDRAARQRTVVKALVLKLLKPQTLANPVTFNAVADRIGGYFTVDDKLTNNEVWDLATSVQLQRGSDIRQLQAPISGFGRSPAGASIDIVDAAKLDRLATALRTDDLEPYWETDGED